MSCRHADRRMPDHAQAAFLSEKCVAASARILNEPVAFGDGDDAVAEQATQIPHLLAEQQRVRVPVAVGREQQRVTALDADVLVIAVARRETFVGVMAEEARQRVTDPCRGSVGAEVDLAATARPLLASAEAAEVVVVDVVPPQGA